MRSWEYSYSSRHSSSFLRGSLHLFSVFVYSDCLNYSFTIFYGNFDMVIQSEALSGEKCSPSYLLLLARGRGPPHHARVYPTLTVVITSQYFMATLTWWWSPRPSWEVCSPSYLLLLTSSSLLIMPEFRWLHDFPTTSQLHNILQQPARGS